MATRSRPIGRCSTAASRNASNGRTRAARREADQTASSEITGPATSESATGQGSYPTRKVDGSKPASMRTQPSGGASPPPTSRPTIPPEAPTTSASPYTMRRTCRPVAPTARSRPSSRRRCAMVNAKVEATTNTVTKPARAAVAVSTCMPIQRVRASLRGSSAPRASPVSTRPSVPTIPRAAVATRSGSASAVSTSPMARTPGASVAATSSATWTPCPSTRPVTVYDSAPTAVSRVTGAPVRSPSARPTTTSPGLRGGSPAVRRSPPSWVLDQPCPSWVSLAAGRPSMSGWA